MADMFSQDEATAFSQDEATADFDEASRRIDVVYATQGTKLDLGRLSRLKSLPASISKLRSSLQVLYLGKTAVSDLRPISEFRNLTAISITNTGVRSLEPLRGLTNLRILALTGAPVVDLGPLQNLYELRELVLNDTAISDLSPLARLYKLRTLFFSRTRVQDATPLAELIQLVVAAEEQPPNAGLAFFDTPIGDAHIRKFMRAPNPWRTFETISKVREGLGLPRLKEPVPAQPELPFDRFDWPKRLSQLQQVPFGAFFVRADDRLVIDPSGDETDQSIADDELTRQLHEGVRRRAMEFVEPALRLDNQVGWRGLGDLAQRFLQTIDCETAEIPRRLGTVYETLIALGSFLDLDARLLAGSGRSAADPLDPELRRVFSDLIRVAAPWVRRFPTARALDDEAGAFLSRTELYEPAEIVVNKAAQQDIISNSDALLLQAVVDAAKRGEFQGQKAGARSIWSSKNLVSALAIIMSFEAGLVNSKAAEQSVIAAKGAQFYLAAEKEILALFDDAPDDIRQALKLMIDDIQKSRDSNTPILPTPPRAAPGRRPEND